MSWRSTIQYTCLSLFVLCVGLWLLSYFYSPTVVHNGSWLVAMGAASGMIGWANFGAHSPNVLPGWSVQMKPAPTLDWDCVRDLITFTVNLTSSSTSLVRIPLWCPTALLALVSWIACRKTRQPGRGFPVEPQATQDHQ
jgi:hypothetical protein